jgi:hypothetical protein
MLNLPFLHHLLHLLCYSSMICMAYDRTSYEAKEKKHWLTVHRGELVGRFLLQDNLKPAWHDDPRSTPVRVRAAVEQLIARLDENK